MRLVPSSKDYFDQKAIQSLRLVLYQDEVCRLPQSMREVRVLSGRAWITVPERDMFLNPGDRITLDPKKAFALASPLGNLPLVMEVWGEQEIGVSRIIE